jgi:hypothetical protein
LLPTQRFLLELRVLHLLEPLTLRVVLLELTQLRVLLLGLLLALQLLLALLFELLTLLVLLLLLRLGLLLLLELLLLPLLLLHLRELACLPHLDLWLLFRLHHADFRFRLDVLDLRLEVSELDRRLGLRDAHGGFRLGDLDDRRLQFYRHDRRTLLNADLRCHRIHLDLCRTLANLQPRLLLLLLSPLLLSLSHRLLLCGLTLLGRLLRRLLLSSYLHTSLPKYLVGPRKKRLALLLTGSLCRLQQFVDRLSRLLIDLLMLLDLTLHLPCLLRAILLLRKRHAAACHDRNGEHAPLKRESFHPSVSILGWDRSARADLQHPYRLHRLTRIIAGSAEVFARPAFHHQARVQT